jgi:ferredoxin-nitrite reductase
MVDDYGAEGMRAEVERRLGRTLEDFTLPPHPATRADHLGVQPESREGRSSLGIPVHVGLITGEQLVGLADLAERLGDNVRVTRQQNLVLTGVPTERVGEAEEALAGLGFDLHANPLRGGSIACTGEPHCNFSVTETKTRLDALIQALEGRFGDAIADLRLHLDGCPHACAQHWVGDIGFQGSTARDDQGVRRQAFEIYLRGSLGPDAAIGRPLFRRVPTTELDETVSGLIAGWLEHRTQGESFRSFCDRTDDEALGALAGREPAKARSREEAAA